MNFVVAVRGTVKLYNESSNHVTTHSCSLGLGEVGGQTYFGIVGGVIAHKKIFFQDINIEKVVSNRLSEGSLSVCLQGLRYATIAISKVQDLTALTRLRDYLQQIRSETVHSPSPDQLFRIDRTTPSPRPYSVHRKLPPIHPHPNNRSRGAVSTESSINAGNFYGASASSSDEPFLPPRSPHHPHHPAPPLGPSLGPGPSKRHAPYYTPTPPSRRRLEYRGENGPGAGSGGGGSQTFRSPPRYPLTERKNTPTTFTRAGDGSGGLAATPTPCRVSPAPQGHRAGEASENGFANLGNTCYMNAVLQSLLGMESFASDVLNKPLLVKTHKDSLFRMLYLLAKAKQSKEPYNSQRILLKQIKQAIASASASFGGYRQQDAHELLGQCLSQLQDEVKVAVSGKQDSKEESQSPGHTQASVAATSQAHLPHPQGSESPCPVAKNFECGILHTITCKNCGKETAKEELVYDFPLQLPKNVLVSPSAQVNLQELFDTYFNPEEVEYTCEGCGGKKASLRHQLARLPRVLVLFLKRYDYSSVLAKKLKRGDNVRIPRSIGISKVCVPDYTPPCPFQKPPKTEENAKSETVPTTPTKQTTPTTIPDSPDSVPSQSQWSPLSQSQDEFDQLVTAVDFADFPDTSSASTAGGVVSSAGGASVAAAVAGSSSTTTMTGCSSTATVTCSFGMGPRSMAAPYSKDSSLVRTSTPSPSQVSSSNPTSQSRSSFSSSLWETGGLEPYQLAGMTEEEQLQLALERSIHETSSPASPAALGLTGAAADAATPIASPTPAATATPIGMPIASPTLAFTPAQPSNLEVYRLVSVVSHLGRGSGGGHYISDVYSPHEKSWKTYNDSVVTETMEGSVRQRRQSTGSILNSLHSS